MHSQTRTWVVAVLLVATMVLAGCSSPGGNGAETTTEEGPGAEASPTETPMETTTVAAQSPTTTMGGNATTTGMGNATTTTGMGNATTATGMGNATTESPT